MRSIPSNTMDNLETGKTVVLPFKEIFVRNNPKEIIRLAYYLDVDSLNEVLRDYNIIIQSESDLEIFLSGKTILGTPHNINLRQFTEVINIPIDRIKESNIEFDENS